VHGRRQLALAQKQRQFYFAKYQEVKLHSLDIPPLLFADFEFLMWPKHVYPNKRKSRITALVINETQIQIGSDEAWLWVAIEPIRRRILGVYISRHRNMLVAESFLRSLVKLYGSIVYSDGGTWYPEACLSLGLMHKLHSSFEKSIIERAMEYVKDRTENFDDYYPCRKKLDCDLNHIYHWFTLFIFLHNKVVSWSINNLIGGDKA
jgi:putative transposase